jgi:hypothetical protein
MLIVKGSVEINEKQVHSGQGIGDGVTTGVDIGVSLGVGDVEHLAIIQTFKFI